MNWKPIETAPKDGTVIDLFYENYGRITDCKWCNNKWSDKDDFEGQISSVSLPHEEPFCWMPVPKTPDELFQSFMANVSYNVMSMMEEAHENHENATVIPEQPKGSIK